MRTTAPATALLGVLSLLIPHAPAQPPGPFPPVPAAPIESPEPPLADPSAEPPLADPQVEQAQLLQPSTPPAAAGPPGSPVAAAPPLSVPKGTLHDPPTPVVGLRVRTPASASVGQDVEYLIRAENTSRATAYSVEVRVPLPDNLEFVRADPPPADTKKKGVLAWPLNKLAGGEGRDVKLVLRPKAGPEQEVKLSAYVGFQHGQEVRTKLTRSRLAVRQTAPASAAVGETVDVRIDVTNTGGVDATDVVVAEVLPPGYAPDPPPAADDPPGKKVWKVGTLRPGQSHAIAYRVKLGKAGVVKTDVVATAAGGVQQTATASVQVTEPRLELAFKGPATAYGGRAVRYEAEVKNTGTAVLHNVVVTIDLPARSVPRNISRGGQELNGAVQWVVTKLEPNTVQPLQVQLESRAAGRQTVRATAAADRAGGQTAEVVTDFLQSVGLDLRVQGRRNPGVGEEFDYTIAVDNKGTVPATDVRVVARLPEQLEYVPAAGAKAAAGVVTFDAVANLPENQSLTFRLRVKARAAGQARLKVELVAKELTGGPIVQEEGTFVVSDADPPAVAPGGGVVPADFAEPAPRVPAAEAAGRPTPPG